MPASNKPSAREYAETEARTHLVDTVTSVIDRTFTDSGHGQGMQMVRDALLRLDPTALQDLLRTMGIEAPEEATEPGPDEGPAPK